MKGLCSANWFLSLSHLAMAISPFQLSSLTSSSSSSHFSYPSTSLYFLSLHSHYHHSSNILRCSRSSHDTVEVNTQQSKVDYNPSKSRRKPRPSFYEQIRDKWSFKIDSPSQKFPWQVQEEEEEEEAEQEEEEAVEDDARKVQTSSAIDEDVSNSDRKGPKSDQVSFGPLNRTISAPWITESKPKKPQFDSGAKFSKHDRQNVEIENGFYSNRGNKVANGVVDRVKNFEKEIGSDVKTDEEIVRIDKTPIGLFGDDDISLVDGVNGVSSNENHFGNIEVSGDDNGSSTRLPWIRDKGSEGVNGDRWVRSKTELAEKSIPEHELKRLRNVALRMMERIKVNEAGVTQALVDSIHEKWQSDEVVKLKFEGLSALNMKRTHENLEKRTGGLVIWRSGSSVVIYRGMTYKLHCAQSYTIQNSHHLSTSHSSENSVSNVARSMESKGWVRTPESFTTSSASYLKDLSEEELMDLNELNNLLDELGPRFVDWSGREPLPIDADLLPPVVPGYKPPFRLLPYGARNCLKNKEMTKIRRLARTMPPHFALGRNRELQGLARAMAKLWERSAIAKIAIKRGVLNTLNERMAEEIKKLTGGTLVSRNKDYIVFYRGNDFLPPAVTEALKEREKQNELRQDEEDLVRQRTSSVIESNMKPNKGPLVAGTLAETMAATSHWKSQPSNKDVEKMIREASLARHASLVRYLQKKLNFAREKAKKAERALSKVQEYLEPSELPTDLETVTDEERFLFRKMGLSMKPFLLLGLRGVFDGTVENMHLHWKFRELVKIIVKGKNFAQVKHIAISLEAESGGVLVSVDKTTKGYAIIVYRGKNYQRPRAMRPKNLLSRRKALARSIELQRREALKHHILDLEEQIELLKSELEEMKSVKEIDENTLSSRLGDDAHSPSDDHMEEDEGEEAYLETYESGDEDSNAQNEDVTLER